MIHPKVRVPSIVLSILTLVGVVATAVAGTNTIPWAADIAAAVLTVVHFVVGYMTPSGPAPVTPTGP